jgi:hypothetical protein
MIDLLIYEYPRIGFGEWTTLIFFLNLFPRLRRPESHKMVSQKKRNSQTKIPPFWFSVKYNLFNGDNSV